MVLYTHSCCGLVPPSRIPSVTSKENRGCSLGYLTYRAMHVVHVPLEHSNDASIIHINASHITI